MGHLSKMPCIVEGCRFNRRSFGYCGTHLYRFKRYGDPLKLGTDTHGLCSDCHMTYDKAGVPRTFRTAERLL